MITATGWTWGEVDGLTLPQLDALTAHWAQHPPAHLSLHAIVVGLGGKRVAPPAGAKPAAGAGGTTAEDLREIFNQHGLM